MEIPKGHQPVMPYLMVASALGFSDFTSKVFDAQLTYKRLRDDSKTVMHAEISINGCTIMFCDSTEQYKAQTANLFVYVDNADERYNLALENGATSVMGLSDQDYGRTCGVSDPFGNVWWITSITNSAQ